MTADLVRYYVLAVRELLGALEYVELVAMPGEIDRFENALREVTLMTARCESQLQPTGSANAVPVAVGSAVPVLGDGIAVAPAIGAEPSEAEKADEAFSALWRAMEKGGWCDAVDGAEYRRVFAQWVSQNRPSDMAAFIIAETCDKRF